MNTDVLIISSGWILMVISRFLPKLIFRKNELHSKTLEVGMVLASIFLFFWELFRIY